MNEQPLPPNQPDPCSENGQKPEDAMDSEALRVLVRSVYPKDQVNAYPDYVAVRPLPPILRPLR